MSNAEIRITGEGARKVAEELREVFKEHFGDRLDLQSATEEECDRADGVTITTMILTIPPTLLATLQIMDRTGVTKKLHAVLSSREKKREARPTAEVHVVSSAGMVENIDEIDEDLLAQLLVGKD